MKTTSTAQYAADAANSSCLLAFVSTDMAVEKSRVKTRSMPTAPNVEGRFSIDVRVYSATTGSANNARTIPVMIRVINFSIRDGE
jgi:hypothetical protein